MMMEKPTQNENTVPVTFVKNAQGEKKAAKNLGFIWWRRLLET
jgi:hypothetical protein